MSIEAIGNVISKVAPLLGTALLGPAAGSVIGLITSAFGGDSSNPSDLLKRINLDPESQVKLAQIESDNIVKLQSIELERLKIIADSSNNPSKREENLAKSGARDYTPMVIAFLVMGVWTIYVIGNMFFGLKAEAAITADLHSSSMLILGYYFVNTFKQNLLEDKKG